MNPLAPQSDDRRAPARVLIVEMHEVVARECIATLKKVNRLDPQWVEDAAAALARLNTWNPQLLIVGEDIKGLCGIDMCKQIREHSTVPLILLSTWPDTEHHIRCLNAGADDCIVYPFEPPFLLARVLAVMRRAYRYSIPPHAEAPRGAPQFHTAQWPRCEACGYIGPREKFQKQVAGQVVQQCPACGERTRIVQPIG